MGFVVFTVEAKYFLVVVGTGAGTEIGAETGAGATAPSVSEVPGSSFYSMNLIMTYFFC